MSTFAEAYRALRLLVGDRVCRVEDTHRGRWWPSWAVRAAKHWELTRGRCHCPDCRRAITAGFLPEGS